MTPIGNNRDVIFIVSEHAMTATWRYTTPPGIQSESGTNLLTVASHFLLKYRNLNTIHDLENIW